jgi:carboxyl-terminal processing protease
VSKKDKNKKIKYPKGKLLKRFFHKVGDKFFDDVEDELNSKASFSIFEVIIIIFIAILFGIIVGYFITYSRYNNNSDDSNLTEITDTYSNILENYYDEVSADDLSNAAIKAMIESLDDPYSNYMDEDTTTDFNDTVDGSFVGIGVTVMFDEEYNVITEVNSSGPADKAGLKVDDIIVKVDDISVKNVSGSELSKLIRGEVGTKVKITVKRGSKTKSFTVKRAVIEVESVSNNVINYNDKKVGYIKIDSFAENTYEQFNKALKRLEKKNIDSLVIDVRDNPGGHLTQTKEILSLFFNKKTVLYQIQSKDSKKKIYSLNNTVRTYPIAVLVNGSSASAAEILASCFKDNYSDAIIVGTTTYGKGTVQKSEQFSNGTSIKYTTKKWLTSKGKWINGIGVEPDYVIEQASEYYDNPNYNTDAQLQEALSKLK